MRRRKGEGMRKLIYHPSGRAGEYAEKGYAVNLFKGCTHGCLYCYVPQFTHQSKESFHSQCVAAPDVLERLKADMKRVGVLSEPIFLCFTTDPYCVDAPPGITRRAIEIILESRNRVNILTKGGMRACADFDLLASVPGNKVGATLTFWDDMLSREWEPKAELQRKRVNMLLEAHERGIETWASIEPVIIPWQSLFVMQMAIPCTDEFKIGRWNHDPRANTIAWKDFAKRTQDLMEKHGKKYMFKKELKEVL
jgi:DNA repair photolyase